MNLLITNGQEDQAYMVVRALRDVADRIVVTLPAASLLKRWVSVTPWSRYVARTYVVPEPSAEWWEGVFRPDNSDDEEAYVLRIEEICAAEAIDAVFPSFDTDIYVLSKNKQRLADGGVVFIGPDFDKLQIPMNKQRTIEAAQAVGFPHPQTLVPDGPDDLDAVLTAIEPPYVIKPRFGAHGKDMRIATNAEELRELYAWVHQRRPRPLVQEYIPGYQRQNYYTVVDKNLEIVSVLSPRVIRTRQRGVVQSNSACISTPHVPYEAELRALVRHLGYWGCLTVQTVLDSRTGVPKLMEINPRTGNRLWYRTELGVNEPEIFLCMAMDQPLPPVPPYPEGVHLADPAQDIRNLGDRMVDNTSDWLRKLFRLGGGIPGYRESQPIKELLVSMRESYFSGVPIVIAPFSRYFFSDPLPCLLRNLKVIGGVLRRQRYFRR